MVLFIEIIIDKKIHGAQILSILYQMKNCGIESVQNLFEELLFDLHMILYNQIISWIFKGEIQDKYEEFFISENQKEENLSQISFDFMDSFFTKNDKLGWEMFSIKSSLIPSYISIKLAEDILFTGRASKVINPNERIKENKEFEKLFQIKNFDIIEFEKVVLGFKNIMAKKLWKLIVIENDLNLQIKVKKKKK